MKYKYFLYYKVFLCISIFLVSINNCISALANKSWILAEFRVQ